MRPGAPVGTSPLGLPRALAVPAVGLTIVLLLVSIAPLPRPLERGATPMPGVPAALPPAAHPATSLVRSSSPTSAPPHAPPAAEARPAGLSVTSSWGPPGGGAPLTVGFSATASGGLAPYDYTWYFGDGNSSFASTSYGYAYASHVYTAVGNYTFTLEVNDSSNLSFSTSDRITVEAFALNVSSIEVAPATVDVGRPTSLNLTASGGEAPYNYSWWGLPTMCSSVNASTLACTPDEIGTFFVFVLVTDSAGAQVYSPTAILTVAAPPEVTTINATPPQVAPGEPTTLSLTVVDGVGTYHYTWLDLPPGCSTNDSSTLPCPVASTAQGAYTPYAQVVDSDGYRLHSPFLHLTVAPFLVGSLLAGRNPADENEPLPLWIPISGGASPASVGWFGLMAGCPETDSAAIVCRPTIVGAFNVSVTVTDADGLQATSGILRLVIHPALTARLDASPNPASVESRLTFSTSISGGTGPYVLSYAELPPGCLSANTSDLACTPTNAWYNESFVRVTDAEGAVTNASVNVTVVPSLLGELLFSGALPLLGAGGTFAAFLVAGITVVNRRIRRETDGSPAGAPP